MDASTSYLSAFLQPRHIHLRPNAQALSGGEAPFLLQGPCALSRMRRPTRRPRHPIQLCEPCPALDASRPLQRSTPTPSTT
jgi:hypothetical protein